MTHNFLNAFKQFATKPQAQQATGAAAFSAGSQGQVAYFGAAANFHSQIATIHSAATGLHNAIANVYAAQAQAATTDPAGFSDSMTVALQGLNAALADASDAFVSAAGAL